MHQDEMLPSLSRAIRLSSLKRLRQVPDGQENWRPDPGAMSFADIAHHLIEADLWLLRKLRSPDLASIVGKAGEAGHMDRVAYARLLNNLERLGKARAGMLVRMRDGDLEKTIPDDRFDGTVSVWWVIVRGNFDHEAHHRGKIAAYLRSISVKG